MGNKKTGIELIAQERLEQIVKHNWTREHDLSHEDGELAQVAALLAGNVKYVDEPPDWGYSLRYKLKGDRIHELKVAGALIAAEIDRLQSSPTSPKE